MRRMNRRYPLLIRGAATYAANGRATIDIQDVPKLPTKYTYVRGIGLRFDINSWTTGGAGDAYQEPVMLRVFDRITLRIPGGHVYYDLPSQAGTNLYKLLWALRGKRPATEPNGTATVLGGGAVTTVTATNALAIRIFHYLPFSAFGSMEQDDINVLYEELVGAQLTVDYPNAAPSGGIFDTGADNQGFTDATLSAWIDLKGSDSRVLTSRFSITQHDLASREENLTFLNEKVLHALIEVPTLADNTITATTLSDANRDEVNLSVAGQPWVDRIDARQLVMDWNMIHPMSRTEHLPHGETAFTFVPIYTPARRDWKFTESPECGPDTKLRVTGTATTPRVVAFYTEKNEGENLTDRIVRAKIPVPAGFVEAPEKFVTTKTATKTSIAEGSDGAQRLPVRIHDSPVR